MYSSLLRSLVVLSMASSLAGCDCGGAAGDGDGSLPDGSIAGDAAGRDAAARRDGSLRRDTGPPRDAGPPPRPQQAELWYAVDDLLVRIALDPADGSVVGLTSHTILGDLPPGQNAITMLDNGALLGARLSEADSLSYFYFISEPPDDADGDVTPLALGVMPDDLMIEALYSDCDGRLYAMDSGEDDTNAIGNRLLRFTGNVLASDFAYVVVSDLSTADVADIDDMSPGITANEISDNPGFAIDTGHIHAFNYETGTGTEVGVGGTYGIHALGGALFTDEVSRLYVLSSAGALFEMDPVAFTLSAALVTGPTPAHGIAGWSGLAGPLTDCDSGFLF